jgi:hypothetical protein
LKKKKRKYVKSSKKMKTSTMKFKRIRIWLRTLNKKMNSSIKCRKTLNKKIFNSSSNFKRKLKIYKNKCRMIKISYIRKLMRKKNLKNKTRTNTILFKRKRNFSSNKSKATKIRRMNLKLKKKNLSKWKNR